MNLGAMQDWKLRVTHLIDHAAREYGYREHVTHWADGSETRTLREVSEELGISQERARQVEIKALRTIRTGRYASTLRHALSEAV